MEKEILKELVMNTFTVKAMLDDYCQVVSKIENVTPDHVRKRIIVSAQHHQDEFRKNSQSH